MKTMALLGVVTALLLLTGCTQAAPDTRAADVKALRDNEAQWNQEFVSKDAEKLVAHYAADAVLMSPGMPPSVGKDAIRRTLEEMVGDPALSLKFEASKVEVGKGGDIGYTQGSYKMTMTGPHSKHVINDHGSYVTMYRKGADGAWKAVADIASSEVPPPAPAPARKSHQRVHRRLPRH
ncbi:MAG: DUF4440 domain-containing protein [Bryobacteraceae bacterium]|jgi:uncharacterized protein (TIGR02246 family)